MTSAEVAIHEVYFAGANTLFARTAAKWVARKMPDFDPREPQSFDFDMALHALEHFAQAAFAGAPSKYRNLAGDEIVEWNDTWAIDKSYHLCRKRLDRRTVSA